MMSQSSFGARIDNAKKIWVHLSTFVGYTATDELSLTGFGDFLDSLERYNVDAADKTESYATATEVRNRSFKEGKNSLAQLAPRIVAKVSSKFGPGSRQVSSLQSMVNKINGYAPSKKVKSSKKVKPSKNAQPPKPEADPVITSVDQVPKSISRREAGLGNKLKLFADIVATVKNYGAGYVPANPELTIAVLESRVVELSDKHKNVTATYSVLRQAKLERVRLYKQLSYRVQCVKNAVKSDFTAKSVEYGLIKEIKV